MTELTKRQEPLKASTTQQLTGKKRKEATLFDLVDTRKRRKFPYDKGTWMLRGFQDRQKNDQQTDSPAALRGGFRFAIQAAANKGWNIIHVDYPPYIGALNYESRKITATTMPTSVAKLHGLRRCFGTSFRRGLWSDMSGKLADAHIRTDANNLVTSASNLNVHLIQMLR